jgi:DNA-binding CsgD family transcriptional regulator
MGKQTIFISELRRTWRWSIITGVVASIFSLMLGLLVQTIFYEIAHSIPPVIRQDAHISLPLCNIFPNIYGCDAWVGALTSLEIWELSLLVGQVSGLLINSILVAILSLWVTIRVHSDSVVPGLLTGLAGGFSSLVVALAFSVPLTIHSLAGVFGILMILLLPLSGLAGGWKGKEKLSRRLLRRWVYFLPGDDQVQFDGFSEKISKRELEVLALVADGYKNNEIAQRLYISKATVKTHLQHLFAKLGVKNRTAAVTQALVYGWLRQEEEKESD